MGALSKAALPPWLPPFSLGCALGLSLGAVLWAQQRRRLQRHPPGASPSPHGGGSRPCRGGLALPRSGKRKAKKHLPRGGGPGDGPQEDNLDLGDCSREILCQDAVPWLEELPDRGLPKGSCVMTGVPDIHEVDPEGRMGIEGWQQWYMRIVELILRKLPEGGVAIFMQTDVKVPQEGGGAGGERVGTYWRWVDKAHLALLAAQRAPCARLLWHKIIFSGAVGIGGGRNSNVAGYTHFLCFSTGVEPESLESFPFPDVVRKGLSTWVSGSGAQAVEEACTHLRARGCTLVVDPFCGEGAVLAIANTLGMGALGLEISKKRAKVARRQDGERLLAADRAERAECLHLGI